MMKLSAILVDDERASLDALRVKIQKVAPDIAILQTFQHPSDAVASMAHYKPDVVFLDIDMPGMDGFSMLRELGTTDFEVIFCTAYGQYAIDALRMSALDFLLKPIHEGELQQAIERLQQKRKHRETSSINTARPTPSPHALFNKIAVSSLRGLMFVPIQDIIRLEADSNYTTFYLIDGRKIVATKTLKDFADILEPLSFARVHRSSLINLQHLSEYIRGEGGTVVMSDGSEVEVSRREKQYFFERIGWN
ncbi:LytR/AlgR family response regulator transcription factor [Spirosoma agri]|uniref:Response regulator transcription factor n=1 Tax=Spirosoma agri TaxID=1987381 RepID=A0A6M0IE50_9BACT|nr:LytTR family DNA-binding domain-containing protein [Spirosoma agri]NEU66097.1 response regulator transcription factor [Spirosoma agri]